MVALLILETFEKIYSIAPDSTDGKAKGTYPAKVLFTRGRPAEEFALIVRQESKGEISIHKTTKLSTKIYRRNLGIHNIE